jgi:hypothetical protein
MWKLTPRCRLPVTVYAAHAIAHSLQRLKAESETYGTEQ